MAQINVRIDEELKKESSAVFEELGIDLTTGIRIYLSRVVKEQGIPFEMTLKSSGLERALAEHDRGEYKTFENSRDLLRDLNDED